MKKILFLSLSCLLLAACVDSGSLLDGASGSISHKEILEDDPYENWLTFKDEELGVSFKYPSDLEVAVSPEGVLDIGQMRRITMENFSIVMTSNDFKVGIGEGCCYYYSGAPFDLERMREDISVDLTESFNHIYNLTLGKIAGEIPAVKFDRINAYIGLWLVPSVLIPYDHEIYTNILITGPALYTANGAGDGYFDEMEHYILTERDSHPDLKQYELILNSLKFI